MNQPVTPEPWGELVRRLLMEREYQNGPMVMDQGMVRWADPSTMPNHWDWLDEYLMQMPDEPFYRNEPFQLMGPNGEYWNFGA